MRRLVICPGGILPAWPRTERTSDITVAVVLGQRCCHWDIVPEPAPTPRLLHAAAVTGTLQGQDHHANGSKQDTSCTNLGSMPPAEAEEQLHGIQGWLQQMEAAVSNRAVGLLVTQPPSAQAAAAQRASPQSSVSCGIRQEQLQSQQHAQVAQKKQQQQQQQQEVQPWLGPSTASIYKHRRLETLLDASGLPLPAFKLIPMLQCDQG